MAEPLFEIASQGVAVHGLDRGNLNVATVILATARSQTEPSPVGRPVTGASESFGVDKGLEPDDGMVVKSLPIVWNSLGRDGEQV